MYADVPIYIVYGLIFNFRDLIGRLKEQRIMLDIKKRTSATSDSFFKKSFITYITIYYFNIDFKKKL